MVCEITISNVHVCNTKKKYRAIFENYLSDGHYLNLPVLDEEKNIVGLIDVLRLTYATLEQVRI